MSDEFYCPRAIENGGGPDSPFHPPFNGLATWGEDGRCSYCGSLNPDTLMARIEAGDVEIEPTDKDYKIYVRNDGGEDLPQSPGKFYFQHMSRQQMLAFIDALNAKRLNIAEPGYFYVLPYFCSRAT